MTWSAFYSRTKRAGLHDKSRWTALLAAAVVAATGDQPSWPPFLPSRDSFSADLAANVERAWSDPTLTRTVRGRPAAVPLPIYIGFVDTPDVTTAAARFRHLAQYQVRALDEDWYVADDHDGSHGLYRVLARAPGRRVMLSWGEHTGRILGTISGSALTVIDLRERDGKVDQELTAYVRINNAVAAALARLLIPIFGHLADRKLTEGFAITAQVAEWAIERPNEFCEWLRSEPLPPDRRERIFGVLPSCR